MNIIIKNRLCNFIYFLLITFFEVTYFCRFCPSTFSSPGNKSRHETQFYPDNCGLPHYQCSKCQFSTRKMSPLDENMRAVHSKFTNCCRSCYLDLNNSHLYAQHMSSIFWFSVFGEVFQPLQLPSQSALSSHLQTFVIGAENSKKKFVGLPDLYAVQASTNRRIIEQKLSSGPQKKFNFPLNYHSSNQNTRLMRTTKVIVANSLMTPVIAGGISNNNFALMVEKKLAVLFTFAFSENGWLLDRLIRLHLNFRKYRPFRGSSFISLPFELSTSQSILNI